MRAVSFAGRGTARFPKKNTQMKAQLKGKIVAWIFLSLSIVPATAKEFVWFDGTHAVSYHIEKDVAPVVQAAAGMFADDMKAVTGMKAVMAGTEQEATIRVVELDKTSEAVREALNQQGIPVATLQQKTDGFYIAVRDGQIVVVGANGRGAAYGLLELSKKAGVNPWIWWGDVVPTRKDRLTIDDGFTTLQGASVEYRGIFLNDEENFAKWSKLTYEKDESHHYTVGPRTYEKVFQLLLRLRANCIWPAMHPCSTPFFTVPGNKEMAQRYGIVMATSHCEPMMRAALEWNEKTMGPLNYVDNHDKILSYWEDRVKDVADGENIYTVGMRGLHDLPMQGASTTEGKIAIVERAFADQRDLLRRYVHADVTQVPQVFVPYKEVLGLYNNGLRVPDDVTLMWCNDNFGYLTRLSNDAERKRKGGAGVYYHISYWGRPNGYLTICTQSPALIYHQMRRAYDAEARKIWIVNVGDLKPGEFDMEFFLNMAWDVNSVNPTNIPDIMDRWYSDIFGEETGKEIAAAMREYYRLAVERKPEHMGWNRVEEAGYPRGNVPVADCAFNPFENGDEVLRRMKAYDALEAQVRAIEVKVPMQLRDAYVELVLTPVAMAKGMNNKWLAAKKNHLQARHGLPAANDYAQLSEQYTKETQKACADYGRLLGGKWERILALNTWNRENDLPRKDTVKVNGDNHSVMLWCEHDTVPQLMHSKMKVSVVGRKTFMEIFTMDGTKPQIEVLKQPDWLRVTMEQTYAASEARLNIEVVTDAEDQSGKVALRVNGRKYVLAVTTQPEDFYLVNIDHTADGKTMASVLGLGYSAKAKPLQKGEEYTFCLTTARDGSATLRVGMLPLHPLCGGDLRYAVSVDGQPWQTVSIKTDAVERDEAWKVNVLRNQSVTFTPWTVDEPGTHRIAIKALDDGIVLDQMQLDFNLERQFYSLP